MLWPRTASALLGICLPANSAIAEVRVYVEEAQGQALIRYQCTGGEVVRGFSLDVSVDQGRIVGISDFFVGESTAEARGYGIFPASFRDHISIAQDGSINWRVSGYSPLAVAADDPGGGLPGLDSSGVTLEFGGLWDPSVPAAAPSSVGTLCALQLTQGATVTVSANPSRGGVVSVNPDILLAPVFSSAFVQPPEILKLTLTDDLVIISFAGGELEAARSPNGPWVRTGNYGGTQTEPMVAKRYYRVRGL
jgi:hypothetical protein